MATGNLSVSTVKPLADRVFVKVSASEEKTAGGLYLPTLLKKTTSQGSCPGPGSATDGSRQEMEIVVGDKVLYSKWHGHQIGYGRICPALETFSLSFHSY